jgi:hypothetical protein
MNEPINFTVSRRVAAILLAGSLAACGGLGISPGTQRAAAADPGGPGATVAPTLTMSSSSATATNVSYSLSFVSTNGMSNGFSTVTLQAPVGTILSSPGCNRYLITDDITRQSNGCLPAVLANNDRTAVITVNMPVNQGDVVTLTANGVTNASRAGRYSLKVSTSSDPTAVKVPFELKPPASVATPELRSLRASPGGQSASYSVSFIATDGLTAGISTIDLAAGTSFPVAACQIYVMSDDTTRQSNACLSVTLSSSNSRQAIITTPMPVHPGDRVTFRISPGSLPTPKQIQVTTSSDPKSISTKSPGPSTSVGLQLTSYASAATQVSYSVSFEAAAAGGVGGGTTIELQAPQGTSFPKTTGCGSNYIVNDDTTGQADGCVTVTQKGPANVSLATNLKISVGDQVTAVAGGVTNTATSGKGSLLHLHLNVSPGSLRASLGFALTPKSSVKSPVLRLTSYSASATDVTYSVSFRATNGLGASYSDILFEPLRGATLPPAACGNYLIFDANTGATAGCLPITLLAGGKGTAIGTGGLTVTAGDEVTLFVNRMGNGSGTGTGHATLSTSSDSVPVPLPVKLTAKSSIG